MSISFDNAANGGTLTVGSNPNRIILAWIGSSGTTNPSTVTCNGVAMTLATSVILAGGNGKIWLYYLLNPDAGSNTVSTTGAGTVDLVASYFGVSQLSPIDNSGTNGDNANTTAISAALTSVADNCWHVLGSMTTNAQSVGTGTTLRVEGVGGTPLLRSGVFDSNGPIHPAGSNTLNTTFALGTKFYIDVTLAPELRDLFSVSDSTAIGESSALQIYFLPWSVNKSESTIVSDTISILRRGAGFVDGVASLVTSSYKWLTQTLYNAQQGFALRPFFSVQVIDDTIQPNAIIVDQGGAPRLGSIENTPDGSIVGAGFGNSGITFYKSANLANGWTTTTLLDSDTSILGSPNPNVSIKVSNWYNGTYQIDIYYFNNFNNSLGGGNLNVVWQRSTDGGATWTKFTISTTMAYTDYNSNPKNLFIAGLTPRLISQVMTSGFVTIIPNGGTMASGYATYDLWYQTYNGSFSGFIKWGRNANSGDWTIHSFDTYFLNGVDNIIMSAFRNILDTPNPASSIQNPNYAIWKTALLNRTGANATDLWQVPMNLMPSSSAVFINQNQFVYPTTNIANGYVDLVFKAITTDSVSQSAQGSTSQVVTTHINYMWIRSVDGDNFSYPQILVDSNGNEFTQSINTPGIDPNQDLVYQNGFYYLGGSGAIWQYILNNIVADVSADTIGYSISETAGQPASVALTIANQSNQWVGASPTNPGAAAIAKNRKIAIFQGFYNSLGVPEVVPRNIFYIDDIKQTVTSTQNDVSLVGRDWFKKLKTLFARFSFQWTGPFFYTDIFDGTTLGNWNQTGDTSWQETGNSMVTAASPMTDSVVTLASISKIPFASTLIVNMKRPLLSGVSGSGYVYPFFIDSDNWLRLNITDIGGGNATWTIEKCVAGVITSIDSNPASLSGNNYGIILIRQYDYYKFNFFTSANIGSVTGNPLNGWTASSGVLLLKNGTSGEIDMTSQFASTASWQKPFTVGLGCVTVPVNFQFFKYAQFGPINTVYSVMKAVATKAGIFAYKLQNTFVDRLYSSNYAGTFTTLNRILSVTAGNHAYNNNSTNNFSNGEVQFLAKLTPISGATAFGFSYIFRSDAGNNQYYMHITQASTGGGYVSMRFERLYSSTKYVFPNSSADANTPATLGSLNLDLTTWHLFKITCVDGWFYVYVDGIMIGAWNDNTTTADYLTTGTWGFEADSNTTVSVQEITSPAFWKPIQMFSLNPGDDAEGALQSLIQTLRGWFFSDLFARFKMILLSSSDVSSYTYNVQLWSQQVNNSDKEYISQVTVYGDGVSATARNTNLMAGVPVRDEVIVDYSIKTQSDAQVRANNELLNANQYRDQYTPKQVINVGAELFDAVTVINTGANTTGVDAPTRVYAEKFEEGGGNNDSSYSLEIDTGNI